ncbi:membrane protein [Thermosipho sp. 1063]|uniref:murein biosynthesis integral membrane protein MurJ n=1 Tax=unclassified Thermosipho (in: thermotogales) TaxID=2676525 RepID=UPI0009493B4B|nr:MULTISPECIES: murein biosynthesis integral membrane protein MurJ [unclassified Thermosipho (in: thermotogales)]ANQ54472.1 membrane protein [Thermosipho sp. 1070]APT72914.1 membrane protein [Thermosipho sp. 1063]OOC42356.1 membrane protein [Thermosipho sp. 1074]
MSIFVSSILFSTATFFSRILGLFRDILFAKYFGVSYQLDAYFIAIMFPFFLRKVFGEGAMSSAFVPLYSEKENKDMFLSSIINGFSIIIFLLLLFTYLFPAAFINLFGAGASIQTKELSKKLLLITAPAVYFIFLWSILYSILNTKDKFFWPALTPSLSNIAIIIGIFLSKKYGILAPTFGFLFGSILMFLSLIKSFFSHKYYFTLKYFPEFIKYFIPTFFTMTISQVNTVVDMNVSSFFSEGSISYLQYASRFYMLPYGLFAVSVSTVVLSKISNEKHLFKHYVNDALKSTLVLTIPSTFGLIYLSFKIIKFFYQHGQFSAYDTAITSKVLIAYSLGLPFYGIYSTLSRSFHAIKNTKIPFYATLIVSFSNIILDLIFGMKWGPIGVAFATSIAGIIGAMYLILYIKIFPIKDCLKILLNSLIMTLGIIPFKNLHFLIQILIAVIIYLLLSTIFYKELIWRYLNAKM